MYPCLSLVSDRIFVDFQRDSAFLIGPIKFLKETGFPWHPSPTEIIKCTLDYKSTKSFGNPK